MNTETVSWVPTVPVMVAGLEGHEEVLVGIIQTVPVCAWTGEIPGSRIIEPNRTRTDANNSLDFFKSFTYFPDFLRGQVQLRLPV